MATSAGLWTGYELISRHPAIFKGCVPEDALSLPSGWCGILSNWCRVLERVCSTEELLDFFILEMRERHGALLLEFQTNVTFSKTKLETIEAGAFALRNRCPLSCLRCGAVCEELPGEGERMLCTLHRPEVSR